MSLPNWSSNPHLRRVLQRMQADYTSIFGGRDRELSELDHWLEDDSPYALLLAPTGRGKTALVWHWLERQQHEWQVIFVPISIRYGNSSQADVLAALTHAFASLYDELDEFNSLQQTPNELRPKLAAYLRHELPDDTRVLLALDGLDEATGWELGSDLLPAEPPTNLKILLAAREMAQHSRADWYTKLGLHAEVTHDFALQGLDRIALKELLIALGTPLDELAGDFDVLGELLRVSAGDPVIVRLLVQLLREERIQIGQLSNLPADDLNAVFALWLQQLDGQQSQQAQLLLHLLASAYGPLSARDLLALAPEIFTSEEQIAHAIAPLARFVIGDAESGYIFSHQKLRELYRDRWDAATLAEWNGRFVRYGKQAHGDPSPYLCRFLVAHLREAGEWSFLPQLLAELNPQQAWAEVRYALEGSYSGYLRDLELLQTWAGNQQDLALSIHCSLITSSITSLSSNINGNLLAQLVKVGTTKGRWSAEAAFGHIEAQRAWQVESIVALVRAGVPIPWERAFELIQQADRQQNRAYIALYSIVPAEFQTNVLEALYQNIKNSSVVFAVDLLHFSRTLNREWQAVFIECILQAERIYSSWGTTDWKLILTETPDAWHNQMLEFIQSRVQQKLQDSRQKLQKGQYISFRDVISIWEFLPREQQQIFYWNPSLDIVLDHNLTESLLRSLPEPELQGIIDLLLQVKPNSENIHKLSAYNLLLLYSYHLPQETQLLDKAMALLIAYPTQINRQIIDLLSHQQQEQLTTYLLDHNAQRNNHLQADQLMICLDYLPNIRTQLVEAILQLIPQSYKSLQIGYYLDLLAYIPHAQQIEVVEQAWQEARTIDSNKEQVSLLIALINHLPSIQRESACHYIFQLIRDQVERFQQKYLFSQLLEKCNGFSDAIYQYVVSVEDLEAFHELVEFFNDQQKQHYAQLTFQTHIAHLEGVPGTLFAYLSEEQHQQALSQAKQHHNISFSISLFLKLLHIPNYPYQQIFPDIEGISDLEERIFFLIKALEQLPQNEHDLLYQLLISAFHELQQQYISLDWARFSSNKQVLTIIVNYFLLDIEQHLEDICEFHYYLEPSEQKRVSALIYDYVNIKPAWTLGKIAQHYNLLEVCLPCFDHIQIQASLEYILMHSDDCAFDPLIPYLDSDQLLQLKLSLDQYDLKRVVEYYQLAHDHHCVLDQKEYYQSLIERLYAELQQSDQWDFLGSLNQIAPYLQDNDLHALYLNSLRMLDTPYLQPEYSDILSEAIPHLQRARLINRKTILLLVRYGTRQNRKNNLTILGYILPPYLETLESEQQQELASQIMQSVNQVVECWP